MPTEVQEIETGYHVNLGTLDKRVNSTKRIEHEEFDLRVAFYMKAPCSMERPVIYIRYNSLNVAPTWNYAQIEETDAYYWITDITALKANCWQISMVIDPLATAKDDIIKTKCFVEYGFNEAADGATFRVQDARQAVSMRPQLTTATDGYLSSYFSGEGCYIMQCVSESEVCAYALTASSLDNLMQLASTTIATELGATKILDEALKSPVNMFEVFAKYTVLQGNVFSSIRSCIWVPVPYSQINGSAGLIHVGSFATTSTGKKLSGSWKSRIININRTIDIPWPASDWKRLNCCITIYVPFFGVLSLPVDKVNADDNISMRFSIDPLDGSMSFSLFTGGSVCHYAGSTNISANYAIGSSNVTSANYVSGLLTMASGGMQFGGGLVSTVNPVSAILGNTGESVSAMAQGASQMVEGAIQTVTPSVTCIGSLGGSSVLQQNLTIAMTVQYYQPVDDPGFQDVYGHPVMKVTTPANGYCKTRGFSLVSDKLQASEKSYVNGAMDSGVFIE